MILRTITCAAIASALWVNHAYPRDPSGTFANSPNREWFDSLTSAKGPCCSSADGKTLSDLDWDTQGDHYRVRIDGQWIIVPREALVTAPNLIGRTMVWPLYLHDGISIRCFMPGVMI